MEKTSIEELSIIIDKFKSRPKKYHGAEIIADFKFNTEAKIYRYVSSDIAMAFNFEDGDAICINGALIDLENNFSPFYARGTVADKIEEIKDYKKVYRVKLKLIFGVYEDVDYSSDGNIIKKRYCDGLEIVYI